MKRREATVIVLGLMAAIAVIAASCRTGPSADAAAVPAPTRAAPATAPSGDALPAAPAQPAAAAAATATGAAPWTLDAFPELVAQSITQERIPAPGPVATVGFGGFAHPDDAATAAPGAEPELLAGRRGLAFPAGGKRCLAFKPEGDALLLYRWTLVLFRAEPGTGSATLLSINDGPPGANLPGHLLPRLEYDAGAGAVVATWQGSQRFQLRSPPGSVARDGRWNAVLVIRRHGRLFLRVNGSDSGQPSPTDAFTAGRPQDLVESRIGDRSGKTPGWALDGVWLGQSELSERTVAKLEAWALTRAAELPGGAAAAPAFAPLIDAEDSPRRYAFDPARWAAWKQANPKEKRLAFQGQSAAKVQPDRTGWVRVFCDDFAKPAQPGSRAVAGSSVGDSTCDIDAGRQNWFAPGTNVAVGGKAMCIDGSGRPWPSTYVPDPAAGTLALRLECFAPGKDGKPGRWRNGQFSSVNAAGLGHSWPGAKGFRVRARLDGSAPGLFPCPLWFYGLDHLFWRTGERIELDIIELDRDWDNYGASHVHPGPFKGLFGHIGYDTMKKSAPDEVRSPKLAAGRRLCGVDAFDGAFHTWEVWIHDDLTYINVDGMEVVRVDTAPEYLERLYMYIDTSLKEEKDLDEKRSYDLVLDQVEAFRPAAAIDAVPAAPFAGRPALDGSGVVGGTITCSATIAGCSDVWYGWYADGRPRGSGRAATYTIRPEDRGTAIRCLVQAVGAKDQPEAWTAPLTVP